MFACSLKVLGMGEPHPSDRTAQSRLILLNSWETKGQIKSNRRNMGEQRANPIVIRIWESDCSKTHSDWLMVKARGKNRALQISFGAKIDSLSSLRLQINFSLDFHW